LVSTFSDLLLQSSLITGYFDQLTQGLWPLLFLNIFVSAQWLEEFLSKLNVTWSQSLVTYYLGQVR